MKKEKSIFIFDLDGTIIEYNEPLHKKIADKICKLEKEEHKVIFATSRSQRGVRAVLPQHLWENTLILCNGAFVLDKGEELLSNYINRDECKKLITYLCTEQIQFYAELGKELYIPNYVTHNFISHLLEEAEEERIYDDFMNIYSRVYKISIVESIEKEHFYQLSKIMKTARMYCYLDNSVDIVSSDISKWEAFKKLNISNEYKKVIAFGNDKNDVELLRNSDIGVAVATEDKELLSFSAVRVSSCKPNAIVSAIDKLLIKG